MQPISEQLTNTVERATPLLRALPGDGSVTPGRWSRRQELGHLIDSASNNHQRFVRALLQDELVWPGYDQEGCVRVQRFGEYPWTSLVDFWASYNRLLAHLLRSVPESKRGTVCRIGDHAPMTLEELAADYIRHMEHHLKQMGV